MTEAESSDVIVVGGGVLGLAIAIELEAQGAKVALLHSEEPGFSASEASGAMLGTFSELTQWSLTSEAGQQKFAIALEAVAMWPEWIDSLGASIDDLKSTHEGCFVLLNSIGHPEIDSENFRAIASGLRAHDEPFSDVSPEEVPWIDPDPLARPLRAMHIPNEYAIDSQALLRLLRQTLQNRCISSYDVKVRAVVHSTGKVTGVTATDGRDFAAQKVVLAGGAGVQELLDGIPEIRDRIPQVLSGVGVSASLTKPLGNSLDAIIRTPNRAFACGLHILPRGGEVYVGATNFLSERSLYSAPVGEAIFLLDCASRQANRRLSFSQITELRTGNRPATTDGYPLIGSTSLKGLSVATGTYRDGLTCAPLIARRIAEEVMFDRKNSGFALFRPERPPLESLSREDSVHSVAMHLVASGFEHDWKQSVEWSQILYSQFRDQYESLLDTIDGPFAPQPDVLGVLHPFPRVLKRLRQYYGYWQPKGANVSNVD